MAVKEGWTGRVYEDFEVGDIYPHPLRESCDAVQVRGRLVDRPMVDRARTLVEWWKETLP